MMFKRKKKTGVQTPEYRRPTPPPAIKPNPNYIPPASVKKSCIYETPCGWCTKWDKKCDKKIPERGQRTKINPVDDAIDDPSVAELVNKMCVSESDHEWECCGISTAGTDYRCKKCGAHKTYPCEYHPLSATI